jgi:branched-chain amino acid transport system permease protein
LLGYSIERVAYRPLRKAPRLAPLITAIGVSIVLQNLAMIIWGRQYVPFPPIFSNQPLHIPRRVHHALANQHHRAGGADDGRPAAAGAEDQAGPRHARHGAKPQVASLMGVNVNQVIGMTFIIGSCTRFGGGHHGGGQRRAGAFLHGFPAGLESIYGGGAGRHRQSPGAMIGGFLLGVIESLGAGYIGP